VKGSRIKIVYKLNTSTLISLSRTIARNTGVRLIHVYIDTKWFFKPNHLLGLDA
jgi:hypothetical protein